MHVRPVNNYQFQFSNTTMILMFDHGHLNGYDSVKFSGGYFEEKDCYRKSHLDSVWYIANIKDGAQYTTVSSISILIKPT